MAPKRNNKRKPQKKTVAKKQTFEKKVLSVIHKQTEDKVAHMSSSETQLIRFNGTINVASDCLRLVPTVTRGTADNERVGDMITLKKHQIQGYFRFDPIITTGQNQFAGVMVRQLIISFKTASNYDAITSDPNINNKLASLLRKGGATVGFTGLIGDVMADINRDVFTVHYDKNYYIYQDRCNSAIGYHSAQETIKFFDFSMKVTNKTLKYSDDVSNDLLPTNYSPVMCFGYTYLDGTAPPLDVNQFMGIHYNAQITYEDN